MSDLTSIEKAKLEKLLGMESGYVLDFSNRSFREFISENIGIDITDPKYNYASNSKANRLRALWKIEDNKIIGKLLSALVEYWKWQKTSTGLITQAEHSLFEECVKIIERLRENSDYLNQQSKEHERQERRIKKEYRLRQLLVMFEKLGLSSDHQQRGFMLQDLVKELFEIFVIPVVNSFQRNSGGEQIDGAFSFQGWHYLVECKWTKKLSDIRDLDSLLGKVNRSGKQTMGLFLSIEGWSENVPQLLKQNPEKCIILMEGCDLRHVLSGALDLEELLKNKLAKLSLDANPYYSAVEMLKGK